MRTHRITLNKCKRDMPRTQIRDDGINCMEGMGQDGWVMFDTSAVPSCNGNSEMSNLLQGQLGFQRSQLLLL